MYRRTYNNISCYLKYNFLLYSIKANTRYILYKFNLQSYIKIKMRNKELVSNKLEKLESIIKLVGYHTFRDEREDAYKYIDKCTYLIQDIQTLLNTEEQDR